MNLYEPLTLRRGQDVRMHPATDMFMMGAVHCEVRSVGKEWVHLYHPASRTRHKFPVNRAAGYFLDSNGNFLATGTPNEPTPASVV